VLLAEREILVSDEGKQYDNWGIPRRPNAKKPKPKPEPEKPKQTREEEVQLYAKELLKEQVYHRRQNVLGYSLVVAFFSTLYGGPLVIGCLFRVDYGGLGILLGCGGIVLWLILLGVFLN